MELWKTRGFLEVSLCFLTNWHATRNLDLGSVLCCNWWDQDKTTWAGKFVPWKYRDQLKYEWHIFSCMIECKLPLCCLVQSYLNIGLTFRFTFLPPGQTGSPAGGLLSWEEKASSSKIFPWKILTTHIHWWEIMQQVGLHSPYTSADSNSSSAARGTVGMATQSRSISIKK